MRRLGEQVEAKRRARRVRRGQPGDVARERRGVAAHVDDTPDAAFEEDGARVRRKARAGRIQHHDVRGEGARESQFDVSLAVVDVVTDPDNVEIARKAIVKQEPNTENPSLDQSSTRKVLDIIQPDADPKSPSFGTLKGETFFFAINKVSNARRGNSDLLPVVDWIETHEQFLFSIHEAALLKVQVIWDILVKGADEKELERFKANFGRMRSGMNRFRNESVEIKAVSPDLNTQDLGDHASIIKRHIASGLGLPEHWLSEGSNANRATACYSEDTEVLTENGWKLHFEISDDEKIACYNLDTEEIEYHVPTNRTEFDYDGDLVHFHGKRVDVLVTPNHRMMLKAEKAVWAEGISGGWEFSRADELPYRGFYFKPGGNWSGGASPETFTLPGQTYSEQSRQDPEPDRDLRIEPWLRFLGFFISEGWCKKYDGSYSVYVSQKKGKPVCGEIESTIKALGFSYGIEETKGGVLKFRIGSKALYLWLKENCGPRSSEKRIPEFAMNLDARLSEILFTALIDGDGHFCDREGITSGSYQTNSQVLADQVQILCIRSDRSSRIVTQENRGDYAPTFRVGFSEKPQHVRPERMVDLVPYSGRVFCFEVPTGAFVTRRGPNRLATIQGNSEMGVPTPKRLRSRQRFFRDMIAYIFDFVIDQAILHGTLPRDVNREFTITMPQIWAIDTQAIAAAMASMAASLSIATNEGWVSSGEAREMYLFVTEQLGISTKGLDVRTTKDGADDSAGFNDPNDKKDEADIAGGAVGPNVDAEIARRTGLSPSVVEAFRGGQERALGLEAKRANGNGSA